MDVHLYWIGHCISRSSCVRVAFKPNYVEWKSSNSLDEWPPVSAPARVRLLSNPWQKLNNPHTCPLHNNRISWYQSANRISIFSILFICLPHYSNSGGKKEKTATNAWKYYNAKHDDPILTFVFGFASEARARTIVPSCPLHIILMMVVVVSISWPWIIIRNIQRIS